MRHALALTLALIAAPMAARGQDAPTSDAWHVEASRSPLDGRETYLAATLSQGDVFNALGRPEKAMLAVSCANGRLAVALSWPAFPGRDGAQVEVSTGEGSRVHSWFWPSSSAAPRAPLMFEGSGNWRRFARAVEGATTLHVRVRGVAGAQETSFALRDLADLMGEAQRRCS